MILINIKIGHSWDVHRLIENRDLYLGGIKIDYDKGLLGHSDADVLLHAVAESIIGALGLGDLGTLYPDTDPSIKGIDSKIILKDVVKIMKDRGYAVNNIDTIVFAEEPKLKDYKPKIRTKLAELLETDESNVNVKATTLEGLASFCDNSFIAAESVILLISKG